MDFGSQNGGKLAPKSDPKLMSTSKRQFSKKCRKTYGKLMIFWFSGVEVGSKNGSKIDQKIGSTREGILASIFHRFWAIWGTKLNIFEGLDGQGRALLRARTAQERPKSDPRRGQERPRSAQEPQDEPVLARNGKRVEMLSVVATCTKVINRNVGI